MKYGLVALCVLLFAGLLGVYGQGPDEKYVTIYNLIQEGDTLKRRDEPRRAAEKYLQAQSLLQSYPSSYPGWNENVVNYRLNYLAEQLKSLSAHLPAGMPTNAPPPSAPAVDTAPTENVSALRSELARLTQLNADLEAKLKEALAAQPAVVDPRELAKAETQIENLKKEIDLLKVSLEQEQAKSRQAATDKTLAQENILIEDFKDKLRRQNALVASLRQENDHLKSQLAVVSATVKLPQDTNTLADELLIAKKLIASLQATNISLKTEKILLETRVEDLRNEAASATSSQVEALLKERDELRVQLAVATRQLDRLKKRSARKGADEVAQQLEAALAKLDVYEATAVPYSPEELVLFKQSATNAPASVAKAETITVKELPPGTGPLIAEAMQASKEKQFDKAEQLFRQVLRQDENHVFTLDNLAMVQIKQDHLDRAEETIQHALALEPKNPHTLFLLGHLKFKQGKYDEALEALSLSAKINPEDPWTQYFLGQTLLQTGNRNAAETALRKALRLNPNWGDAHHALAQVYATQKPPFKELAQYHYNKALANGHVADPELKQLISGTHSTSTPNY